MLTPALAFADSGRFFVKTTSGFWKVALGARHVFDAGFSAELNDFQFRFAKIFGLEVEEVDIFNVLPESVMVEEVIEQKASEVASDVVSQVPASSDVGAEVEVKPENNKGNKPDNSDVQRIKPSDQTPWGIEVVYNNSEIASTSGGFNVNVAVLDTGVNFDHPDLSGVKGTCFDFTSPVKAVKEGSCGDKNGHGTHVAGIVGANSGADGLGVYGVAPLVSVSAYKVCGNNGFCFADDIASALRHAADNGINVVNMSLGSDADSSLISSAVDYAFSKGVLMVSASGNDGPFENSIDFPAAYKEVVAVGAINSLIEITEWSSRGNNLKTEPFVVEDGDIEFALPGENIESTWKDNGYAILSGTSMASPFLSGLAAKYWQFDAEDPAAATREFLHLLASDIDGVGDDNASGFGLVRVSE